LIEVGESEALRDKHLEYFLTLAETAEPHLIRTEQLERLDRLEADHENLRLALEWALSKESPEPSLRLCAALGMFWYIHCHWKEGARWLERALSKPSQESNQNEKIARARAFYQDAGLAHQLDDIKRGRASSEASLALCRETGQRRDLAIAQFYLAHAIGRSGDKESAKRLWEQSLTDFRELQDQYWEAKTQFYVHATLDELSQPAVDALLIELARKAGERVLLAQTLSYKSTPLLLLGRIEEAEQHLAEIQMLYKEVGYVGGEELIYGGSIAHYRNNYSQARIMYMTCTERLELLGEKEMRSYAVHYLGLLARDEGDLHTAQTHLEEALEVARYFGTKHVIVLRLALLGQILYLQGQVEIAKKHFAESLSLELGREASSHYLIPLILGCSLFADLIPSVAVKILACTTNQKPVRPEFLLIKRDFEKILAQAQTQLNESAFQAAWSEGEKMMIEEALDLALKTLDKI
jgi:tetratricopeptide (TPR) repeat protein